MSWRWTGLGPVAESLHVSTPSDDPCVPPRFPIARSLSQTLTVRSPNPYGPIITSTNTHTQVRYSLLRVTNRRDDELQDESLKSNWVDTLFKVGLADLRVAYIQVGPVWSAISDCSVSQDSPFPAGSSGSGEARGRQARWRAGSSPGKWQLLLHTF